MKARKPSSPKPDDSEARRLDLEKEIISDLEASDEDTEAIRGGGTYSRGVGGGFRA